MANNNFIDQLNKIIVCFYIGQFKALVEWVWTKVYFHSVFVPIFTTTAVRLLQNWLFFRHSAAEV